MKFNTYSWSFKIFKNQKEQNFLKLINNIYKNFTAKITIDGEKLKALPPEIGKEAKICVQYCNSTWHWKYQPM